MEQWIIGIGLVVLCLIALWLPKLRSRAGMTTAENATVISRRGQVSDSSYSNFRSGRVQYLVTFRIGEEDKELAASAGQYTRLMEGTRGRITWQDRTLVEFIPESE